MHLAPPSNNCLLLAALNAIGKPMVGKRRQAAALQITLLVGPQAGLHYMKGFDNLELEV